MEKIINLAKLYNENYYESGTEFNYFLEDVIKISKVFNISDKEIKEIVLFLNNYDIFKKAISVNN